MAFSSSMSESEKRVRTALNFKQPDRVPRYDSFWPEFTEKWRLEKGLPDEITPDDYYQIDLTILAADETPWPTRSKIIEKNEEATISRDGWGRLVRTSESAKFSEILEVPVSERADPADMIFDDPLLPERYATFTPHLEEQHKKRAVFAKTGGPFYRTANLRGEVEWLIDLATDEEYAKELGWRVTEHLTAVGAESLRLGKGKLTGIWIFDDIGSNSAPMVSPRTFERVFLPMLASMIAAYKAAGAQHVIFHSDGNIEPLLGMLIEAGVNGIQPIEPKAGMDIVAIRKRYGEKLALLGGLDNAFILPSGDRRRIEENLRYVLSVGREGGLILCSHSIGPDVTTETYDYLSELEDTLATYPLL